MEEKEKVNRKKQKMLADARFYFELIIVIILLPAIVFFLINVFTRS